MTSISYNPSLSAVLGSCCRLLVFAGSEPVVQQASLGSMVKAQKSSGRKSSHCLRRQVLERKRQYLDVIVKFFSLHCRIVENTLPLCHLYSYHCKKTNVTPRVSVENTGTQPHLFFLLHQTLC